jgi:hypothetical protein
LVLTYGVGRAFHFENNLRFQLFEKVRIKEPSVPVISKTLKNRRASGKNQRLSGQLFVFFKKIVNCGYLSESGIQFFENIFNES